MKAHSHHCPNCSAPLEVPLGEVEALCAYCGSRLRFMPEAEELEVVRTREEMKYRERVAVQKQILRDRLEQEEMDRWGQAATRVAIAAMPAIGGAAGRAMFGSVAGRGGGCVGCGCLAVLAAVGAVLLGLL
jgi:uncharacterized Zn finger protein (UPF0148 family)